jgi:hypothetical protein
MSEDGQMVIVLHVPSDPIVDPSVSFHHAGRKTKIFKISPRECRRLLRTVEDVLTRYRKAA